MSILLLLGIFTVGATSQAITFSCFALNSMPMLAGRSDSTVPMPGDQPIRSAVVNSTFRLDGEASDDQITIFDPEFTGEDGDDQ